MSNFRRWSPAMLVIAGTAFLLMGAGNQVKSDMTGSVTTSVTGTRVKSSTTVSAISRVTPTQPALSAYAEELAKILEFDRNVLVMVKEETQEHIHRLIGFDEYGYQIIAPGVAVPVPEDRTDRILASLQQKLRPLHYMAFVVEINSGLKVDKIGILKGADQYDILRIMHTDGDEYDITNQDVIDRLKEWEKIASFDIIGADSDWVEIEFKSVPKDLNDFAEEVYEFCPDAVDQGSGSVEGLIKEIKRTKRLFLWWD